jgi:hypothetical protein
MSKDDPNLDALRAEHLKARDALQLARANLEKAQVELAYYQKLADAAEARLAEAIRTANRRRPPS